MIRLLDDDSLWAPEAMRPGIVNQSRIRFRLVGHLPQMFFERFHTGKMAEKGGVVNP